MTSSRIEIRLTEQQRSHLDVLARGSGRSIAEVIGEAVDEYLDRSVPDPAEALEKTFGVAPDFEVPSRRAWDGDESGRSGSP